MKKKALILVMIAIATMLLTGCDGNVTRNIRHAGFNLSSSEFECSAFFPENKKTVAQEEMIYTNGTYAITKKGNLYDISLSQPYVNKENCKKIDFDVPIVAYMDSSILKGENNKFYYAPGTTNSTPLTEVTTNDSNYQLYELLLGNENVEKVMTIDSNNGIYYSLENGTVYQYNIVRQDYNSPYIIASKTPVYEEEKYGKIIDFNYAGESTITYIKTENEIYRMQKTNEEDCSKYADVKCEYKFKKDKTLTEYYKDKILYYGPSILITTYKKEFTPIS